MNSAFGQMADIELLCNRHSSLLARDARKLAPNGCKYVRSSWPQATLEESDNEPQDGVGCAGSNAAQIE